MAEGEVKKEKVPIRVFQQKKPSDGEGYTWRREAHADKPNQVVSWRRVSTTGHSDEEGFVVPPEAKKERQGKKEKENPTAGFPTPEQLDESRKQGWRSGVEESQPQGDKD